MIPVRDNIPSRIYPVVNNSLIAMNVLVYLVQMFQGADLNHFVYVYGLVPARYSVPDISAYFPLWNQLLSLFSFMFLHGGFWHLLGNMWFLYIFGNNIEDRLGPFRYLLFYLLCGFASGVCHLMLNLHSNVPTIGASGAVAGVMGAYFILYPHSRILTLIPILFIPWFIEIPAFFFLGLWFVMQLLNAAGSHGSVTAIAWWAHVGGFIFGIVFLKMFGRLPEIGVTDRMRNIAAKKHTPRLQMIQAGGPIDDPDLYGTLTISPYEALAGTRKIVNIPWGFQKRIYRVVVPAGVKDGQTLRLSGMGKMKPDGTRGDLLLKVVIRQPF